LPRNFIRPCLLLLIAEQPSHGYDLLERLGQIGVTAIDPGGLYRTLRSMDREGLVTSSWEVSKVGPARRTYQLTDEGREWLHAWAGALRESRNIVSAFLRRYETAVERVITT
jgi:poly-beta-hydroxybutyrate-responsive repressor